MKPDEPIPPPRWIERILQAFLDGGMLESALGDISEKFNRRRQTVSPAWAKLLYALEGLGLLRLAFYGRKSRGYAISLIDMWKNYSTIAVRNLKRERVYSCLNVFGLAVGVASVIVIYRYAEFELSYDTFHTNHQRIYRLTEEFEDDAQRVRSAMSHAPVADILYDRLPGIGNVTRIYPLPAFISAGPQAKYRENRFCFADSLFFETFSFRAIRGSLEHALEKPYSVVLTERMATKYFGTTDIIGRELFFEDEIQSYTYDITAVVENVPQNSHFDFDFIASFSTLRQFMPWYDSWYHPPMYVYLLMEKRSDPGNLKANIQSVLARHQPDFVREEQRNFILQRITDIHLDSRLEFEWEINSDRRYVGIFGVLGVVILLIACVNFMNLATAQASKRSLEIGIRKTFGGSKTQLFWQFMTETLVYVTLSFLMALILAEGGVRFVLNDVIRKDLSLATLSAWPYWPLALGFILIVAFVAGTYPSLYLARLQPSQAAKAGMNHSRGRASLRKGLVTFQFVVSSMLICATVVIVSQIRYFRNKNLGFDKDHIIAVGLTDRYAQRNYLILKNKLLGETAVRNAGLSSALPGTGSFHGFEISAEGMSSEKQASIKTLGVDEDFLETYGIRLLKGRDFSADIPTDQSDAFILNKAAAMKLGWNDPVGKDFGLTVYIDGPVRRTGKVIGLIDDFHFQSLHDNVEPLVLYINKHPYYAEYLSVGMEPGNLANSVAILQKHWKSFHPEKPLEFHFLNSTLDQLYNSEIKMSSILTSFTLVAIALSSLGLFALSSYTASKRSREMSIRKVFGATLTNILSIQLREYTMIVIAANAVVIPLCWYWADSWLDSFAYHVSLSPYMFAITVISSLLLAVLTVSFHVLRLARQNPAAAMRHE